MTPSDREAQYIKETGDKRPDFKDYGNDLRYSYEADYDEWKNGFISWLEKQLEKAEEENKEKLSGKCAQCGEITTSIHLLNDDDPDPSQRKIIFWCDNCLNKLKT